MNDNNKKLAGQIAQNTGKLTPLAIQGMLDNWKRVHFPKLAALARTRDEAERLYTVCMNTISKTPKLLECSFESIANCILTSYQLNLYPGPMQECAYVPFAGVATFMPQYQGIVKLCYNSGFIKSIATLVVWEGEIFEYEEGLNPTLRHVPNLDIDHAKAARLCVYCVIKTRYDDCQITVLSPRFIAGIKGRSKGAKKDDSPWNSKIPDDVDWMWKKTALKQALKLIPKSSELADAIDLDNQLESERPQGASVIDLTPNQGAAAGPMSPPESSQDAPGAPEQPTPPERQEVAPEDRGSSPQALGYEKRESITIPPKPEPQAVVAAPKQKEGEKSPLELAQERVKRENGEK